MPKPSAPGMRQFSVFEPGDLLVYNSLAVQLAREFESLRPRSDQNVVFSYRGNPERIDFVGGIQSHRAFRQQAKYSDRAIDSEYILKADIKEFYPSIPLDNLENSLSRLTRQEKIAEYLMRLVRHWNSNFDGGLLIGSLASSLLAEALLIPVDQNLLREGFQYCRFSDDFVFFCSSQDEAHDALDAVTQAVGNIGLAINPSKTKILRKKVGQAADRYEIVASNRLDERISQVESGAPPENASPMVRGAMRSLKRVDFDELYVTAMETQARGDIQRWIRSAVFLRNMHHTRLAAQFVAEHTHHTAFFVSTVKRAIRRRTQAGRDRMLGNVSELLLDDASHPFSRLKGLVLVRGSAIGASRATRFLREGDGTDDGYLHRLALECLGTEPAARSVAERYLHSTHGWCRRAAIRKLPMATDKQHKQFGNGKDDPITNELCA
ncbi:RNA-directed DNA polymerase [Rhizobium sp. BK251]|uniref:RNA-directed DNA polymerase n=1 Tax=Rhizobium sp. BK251 TaxID=2512125 RepID=UPI00140433C1|nr:RNA-directed DNA polymerase [Rhizobium sp. BK251]